LVDGGFIADRPYYQAALAGQIGDYTPPAERNFFTHVTALDPLPLSSHQTHWIELARLRHEPHPSPIRDTPPLFNIFEDRSEGWATAMEEVVMQAGLYDDTPHGRELVWAMLANRAARGLASLRVQANEIGLAEAGKFHAGWTPRGWSDASSRLVGFEQLLYLRQPGYGPSYIVGKAELDHLLALASHRAEQDHRRDQRHGHAHRLAQHEHRCGAGERARCAQEQQQRVDVVQQRLDHGAPSPRAAGPAGYGLATSR
jgi:hypothetical protein